MSDLEALDRRVHNRLSAADLRKGQFQEQLRQRMESAGSLLEAHRQREIEEERSRDRLRWITDDRGRFDAVADRLIKSVILPRVEKLASSFGNAKVERTDAEDRPGCICRFCHTERFPVTATVEMTICHCRKSILIAFTADIFPATTPFESQDQICLSSRPEDEDRLGDWVDRKLLGFLDAYLSREYSEEFRIENMVTDPVCGMQFAKTVAATEMEYEGKVYYFCVPDCRHKFSDDPKRYLAMKT